MSGVGHDVALHEHGMDAGPGVFGAATAVVPLIRGWRMVIIWNQSVSGSAECSHSPQDLFVGFCVMAAEFYQFLRVFVTAFQYAVGWRRASES